MTSDLIRLIEEYLNLARQCLSALGAQLGTANILAAVNGGSAKREGWLDAFGGGTYYVHGVGCRIDAKELEIDFDLGPDGTVPGFDPWKLFSFARNHAEAYPWLPTRAEFKYIIQKKLDDGTLCIAHSSFGRLIAFSEASPKRRER